MGSNILGSIYTTTISSEKYIVISSQNIELSGNVIIKEHVTISNGLLNTNSLIPNVTNSASLGSIDKIWSNAYIHDVSINNNLQVTGNVYISGNLEASNIYTMEQFDNSYANVYTIDHIDSSFQNVYTRGAIDTSFGNVYTRGAIDNSFADVYTIIHIDNSFQNVYTRRQVDTSFENVYTRIHIDNSYANVYTIEHFDNSFGNVYNREHVDNSFTDVYTITQFNNSYSNVYTRGVINTSFANVYTRIQVDNSFVTKRIVELSLNALPASSGGGGSSSSIVLTSISNDLVPLTTNTYDLGSTSKFWNNAYIKNLRASNRAYQDINSGPFYEINSTVQTWDWHKTNAESLGKTLAVILSVEQNEKVKNLLAGNDAFIGGRRTSNSTTAGGKTSADWEWVNGDIWSYTNFANGEPNNIAQRYSQMYSNGTWDDIGNTDGGRRAVYMSYGGNDISWSAVNGYYGLAKDAYPSLNPLSSGLKAVKNWTGRSQNVQNVYWRGICWSPELRLFVAVADPNGTANHAAMYSSDGINWTTVSVDTNSWFSVCWSPQLRLFVAVAMGGSNRLMTSSNGTSWTMRSLPVNNRYTSICWSPELGIFVAVAEYTSNVITSNDGIYWTVQSVNFYVSWFYGVCWSPELMIFVAVGYGAHPGISSGGVMISSDGVNWVVKGISAGVLQVGWFGVCWSPELGLFVAACGEGSYRVMISSNGMTWTPILVPQMAYTALSGICWSPQLKLFVAVGGVTAHGGHYVFTSPDGINWNIGQPNDGSAKIGVCWSPELGICVAVHEGRYANSRVLTSSLKGRPPTSYNVFDSTFNSIDETGKWTFQNMDVTTLTVTGSFTNSSDDRLKHNEVVIANGLDVIDRLNPKFYQKTQTLLDASYNGDLSGQAWTYEAGLIAQEVLQIPDLSFAVNGGDYYQESYILKNQSNDTSNANYDPCGNYYDMSANYDISTNYINRANYYDTSANYDISYNLITQPYSLNYNSIYVYVFAAIKELHAKVKAQETAILNRQAIINNCITRIETLEQRNQV